MRWIAASALQTRVQLVLPSCGSQVFSLHCSNDEVARQRRSVHAFVESLCCFDEICAEYETEKQKQVWDELFNPIVCCEDAKTMREQCESNVSRLFGSVRLLLALLWQSAALRCVVCFD